MNAKTDVQKIGEPLVGLTMWCSRRWLQVRASKHMNPPVIDTSSLLTMLGIIAAVWAIVPMKAKLTFRLSFSWLDWLLIWIGILAIHFLVFEQVLRTVIRANLAQQQIVATSYGLAV